jgi:hypothetical protein
MVEECIVDQDEEKNMHRAERGRISECGKRFIRVA